MSLGQRLARLAAHLQDPRKVAAFQRLCGVEGPSGWAGAEQRGPVANGGPAGGQEHPTGNGAVPGAAGSPRRWRRRPRRNSLTEEEDGSQEFATRSRFLYYLFSLGTELGNELFYILFFPFCIWNVDAWLGRRLIIIWVWVMYLGQCTKDVIRWPRPASPPVVKLEVFYNSEYSMPSTHAMSGTAIPLALLLLSYGRWQYPLVFGLILAFCWCFLVCCSRIYMGMHSILDVIAGFLYAILILVIFHPLVDLIDNFNLTYKYAPLIIISLHLALGIFSFTLDTWSTSRGDTAQILGCGAGVACGSHVSHTLGLQLDPPPHSLPLSLSSLTVAVFGKAILRLLLGVIVLLLTKVAMKRATIPLACRMFRVPQRDVRRARQRMEVELPYRYVTYGMVGFSLMVVVPGLFHFIGLS
ncbi:sphingosine-1-phosphate phosphatase 1 [Ammospiza nelsoni]|uniref:sphingosine-1-phosphate phosphatase 1 n=1 Tax=Ammospiza caudacuta TaxID=2857398 RepID=UPI002739A3AA|nr:sphingosine-1-phosphate phosphatase 1 [Ammospiza caudacuta]XP_059329976.1 sphingosine-1-phosphate phosphatase 1 [Ammospiza nelsoni]